MCTQTLSMARDHVGMFSDQVMRAHEEAMDCRDCEDFLKMGIEAFRWIERAHNNIYQSIYDGDTVFDHELDESLTKLYESWLTPCAHAEKWIAVQVSRGYYPDNLTEFRTCQENARDILEQRSLAEKGRSARMGIATDED